MSTAEWSCCRYQTFLGRAICWSIEHPYISVLACCKSTLQSSNVHGPTVDSKAAANAGLLNLAQHV